MAIQRLPVEKWAAKALNEKIRGNGQNSPISLAKASGIDPFHRKPTDPPVDLQMGKRIINSLLQIKWDELNSSERMAMIRAYQVAMVRFRQAGLPNPRKRSSLNWTHDFPSQSFEMNWLLCETLSFLEAPSVADKGNGSPKRVTHSGGTDGICPVTTHLESRMEHELRSSISTGFSRRPITEGEQVSRNSSNSSAPMQWPA